MDPMDARVMYPSFRSCASNPYTNVRFANITEFRSCESSLAYRNRALRSINYVFELTYPTYLLSTFWSAHARHRRQVSSASGRLQYRARNFGASHALQTALAAPLPVPFASSGLR